MIGQKIKTGKTGTQPAITEVLWEGTAEVVCYESARVPAAFVDTNNGRRAVIFLKGREGSDDGPRWWDARCIMSREWEESNGQMIRDTRPEVATQIDIFLAASDPSHEAAYRDLNTRISQGIFSLT